jgi:non-canonical poly(A) RNA polymerase PAPD5/7
MGKEKRRDEGSIKIYIFVQVPIVKYVDSETNCHVDVCFNQTNGPSNSKIIRKYLNEYWELRPLVMVLKYFLLQRDLNETYSGGIGSYSLVLLVISFLQV